MEQLIENRYIGAKVGDVVGVVDRRGFLKAETIPEPTGNQDIDTLDEYNVADKATARIGATERTKIIPENIKKDVTILGVTGTHEGGQQPILYAPVITGGVNSISWANNPDNGAFGTVVGTIDGNVVTSPLTITQAMDGKTLVLTASEEDFQDKSVSIVLSYLTANIFATVEDSGSFPFGLCVIANGGNYLCFHDGTSQVGTANKYMSIAFRNQRTLQLPYYLQITNNASVQFRQTFYSGPDEDEITLVGSVYQPGSYFRNVSISLINKDTQVTYTANGGMNQQWVDFGTVPAGIYAFILNATL